jgi:RNA polymerase sigma-70 factor (ECF subfamily)
MDAAHERELVERCRRDEPGAFEQFVDQFKHLVFALISRSIPDRSRAEDLAQDVFLRVHRGLPYFRGEARVSTWIYRIVINVCSQEKAQAAAARPSVSLDDPDAKMPAPSAIDRRFNDLELRDRLDKAIQQLPAQYRVLIAAHYLEGVQYEDLAAAMDMPLGTVKTQLHRAKRQLRQILEGELK